MSTKNQTILGVEGITHDGCARNVTDALKRRLEWNRPKLHVLTLKNPLSSSQESDTES
jgi:hypothetical protein